MARIGAASLLLLLAAGAAVCSAQRIVTPTRPECGSGWIVADRPAADERMSLQLALHSRNMDEIRRIALAVSDPKSPEYGRHLSAAQVREMTAPSAESVAVVTQWLDAHNAEYTVDDALGTVTVDAPVALVERLLSTTVRIARNTHTGQRTLRAAQYALPAGPSEAIQAVFGIHGLPLPPKPKRARSATSEPPIVTPDILRKAYSVSGVTPSGTLKNRQAVAEFQGQLMNDTDLEVFFKMYVPDAPAGADKVYAFHGTKAEGLGIEAQLDIQFIMGVAPGIKTEFYEQMNDQFCSDLKAWTGLLLGNDDIPLVHSVSYGWQGPLSQLGCEQPDVDSVDADFAKLAARGITIIFASGDSGSGYAPPAPPQPAQCSSTAPGTPNVAFQGTTYRSFNIDPREGAFICCQIAHDEGVRTKLAGWTYQPTSGEQAKCTLFSVIHKNMTKSGDVSGLEPATPPSPPTPKSKLWPSWPASSPWVTSVGATRFINDVVDGPEAAVSEEDHFGSGGGFSDMFNQTSWQADAVKKYFETVAPSTLPDPSKAEYNKNGRATPDVGALGTGFSVIDNGKPLPGGVGGTSASAPTFAAIVSLLNEARITAGKSPLGFLNPMIYQNTDAFTDVTQGSDKIGRGGPILPYGFNCTTGWDPITGVGTPMFSKLLDRALALP